MAENQWKMFEEVVYRDAENNRQLGKVYGFLDNKMLMIYDLKTREVVRLHLEKIEGKIEF